MEALKAYAGSTVSDVVRSGKRLAPDAVIELAHALLANPDAHLADFEKARIDADGILAFPAGSIERTEAEFCLRLGFLLSSLVAGERFAPSMLLDGVDLPADVPWPLACFIRGLTDPIRAQRSTQTGAAQGLLERARTFSAAATAPWQMFRGGPERSGIVASAYVASSQPAIRWYLQTAEVISSPVLIDSNFLLLGTLVGKLLVLDRHTGYIAARAEIGAPSESTAAVAGGRAYIGSDEGVLQCFDLLSLKALWKRKLTGMVRSSPLVAGSSVYTGTTDPQGRGAVHALDAETGKPQWAYRCADVFSSPTLAAKIIVAGCDDKSLHAIDPATGRKAWAFETGAKVRATAACSGDIFFGSFDGTFYCLSQEGALRWKHVAGGPYYSSPSVGKELVVCGSHDGFVYAFDRATGEARWKFATGAPVVSSPVLLENAAIVTSTNGTLYVLAIGGSQDDPVPADGRALASISLDRTIRSSPLLGDGVVYVGHEGGISAVGLS
ncbi:MAG: PQQ-binding-like beta-propeller repeat protein [Acidobacteriota bacterium]